jgi:hypothetical protein
MCQFISKIENSFALTLARNPDIISPHLPFVIDTLSKPE